MPLNLQVQNKETNYTFAVTFVYCDSKKYSLNFKLNTILSYKYYEIFQDVINLLRHCTKIAQSKVEIQAEVCKSRIQLIGSFLDVPRVAKEAFVFILHPEGYRYSTRQVEDIHGMSSSSIIRLHKRTTSTVGKQNTPVPTRFPRFEFI